jgi:2-oxoglutarate ferredoxin oxidoreductase subunit beta
MTDKEAKDDNVIYLEHGKPLVYGKNHDKGIRMRGTEMEVVQLGDGIGSEDCVVWDESLDNPATAFLAAQLLPPNFPTALGVFRNVTQPAYEERVVEQIQQETDRLGIGKLDALLKAGDTWTVGQAPS